MREHDWWTCPRCGEERPPQFKALSRSDNESYVCAECGTDEAMMDFRGEELPGPTDWPVDHQVGEFLGEVAE